MDWGYVTGYFDGEGTAGVYRLARSPAGPKVELQWNNSHLASLEAIRAFIGCGVIRHRKLTKGGNKPMHVLVVQRKDEIAKIVPSMLPHSIIKRDALQRVLDNCIYLIAPYKRGLLAAVGIEGVRAMYQDEGMSMADIGERVGVTWTAVKHFMHKNGMQVRAANDPVYDRAWKPESKAKSGRSRAELWKDPVYRTKAVAAIRAGQTKRQASLQAKRLAHQPQTEFME